MVRGGVLVYFLDRVAVQLSNDSHWGEENAQCSNLRSDSRFSA